MGQGGAGRGAGGRDLKLQLAQLTAGPLQEGPDRAMSSILLETSHPQWRVLPQAGPALARHRGKEATIDHKNQTRHSVQRTSRAAALPQPCQVLTNQPPEAVVCATPPPPFHTV